MIGFILPQSNIEADISVADLICVIIMNVMNFQILELREKAGIT